MTEINSKKEYSWLSRILTGSSAVLFFMFILLKPYYLKPSGSIGTADICLAAAGAAMLAAELVRITQIVCGANDKNVVGNKLMHGTLPENAESVSFCDKDILEVSSDRKNGGSSGCLREMLNVCAKGLLYRRDIALYVFILFAAVINAVYSIRLGSHEYTKYTMYWIFNGLAIWTLRKLRDADQHLNGKLCVLLEIDIVIQFIIMLSGRGRYFVEYWGAVRYMGSFNDPNQLAFFMFVLLLLIYSLTDKNGRALHLQVNEAAVSRVLDNGTRDICNSCLTEEYISQKINADNKDKVYTSDEEHVDRLSEKLIGYIRYAVYILAIIIIIKTKSTGIMLGVAAFAFLSWCRWIWEAVRSGRISKKLIAAIVIVCAACAAGLLIYIWPPADFDVKNVEYNTLTRIQEKLWKLSQGGVSGFLIDRGGGKLAAFPQYMLFGAGEGGFDRFAIAGQEINEIHCGPMSILFCYGIIPAVFMIKWLVDSLKRKNSRQFCACLALIAESMTLINYRQPMFWFLLM